MSLTVSHLDLVRSGRLIVSDVSFEVAPGTAKVLRGPNGVGKSTLLRALCGLLPIDAGTAHLGDIPLADRDAWVAQIAYAGHSDALKPQFTVGENIRFWAGLLGGDAHSAIDAFQLAEIIDRPIHACSAGQKRRTGLARLALSADRPLWLLDEPTVSLDAATVALVAEILRTHLARGGMALIATHIDLGLDAETLTLTRPTPRSSHTPDPFLTEGPL
ncbi:MAG: heme ABC exporter ATP-binding protein CcmA [Pseudomonadota bacterium]